jgi:hypothetical protein
MFPHRYVRFLLLGIILFFLIFFWEEIWTLLGVMNRNDPAAGDRAAWIFWLQVIEFVGIITILSWLVGPFILPIRTFLERLSMVFHIFMFSLQTIGIRLVGPNVSMREGKIVSHIEKHTFVLPGVMQVDSNSAAVLERKPPTFSQNRGVSYMPKLRVVSAGIHFIKINERLRGVIDLRPQQRCNPNVIARTRDGIQVKATVNAFFTIGERHDVITVTVDPYDPTKVCELFISFKDGVFTVNSISFGLDTPSCTKPDRLTIDGLDWADQQEILHSIIYLRASNQAGGSRYRSTFRRIRLGKPFDVIEKNILKAVCAGEASTLVNNQLDSWANLPVKYASDIFRRLISQHAFNDFFTTDIDVKNPIFTVVDRLSASVKYQGVLAYQYIERKDGGKLRQGDQFRSGDVYFFPPQELTRSTPIRDRGIKIHSANFVDLKPAAKMIHDKFLETWKLKLKLLEETTTIQNEREIIRIKNEARLHAQKQLVEQIKSLQLLAEESGSSQETFIMNVLTLLETITLDLTIKHLLSEDTVNSLAILKNTLLPDSPMPYYVPPTPP